MAKADWGLKRVCPNCGNRYYDMKKQPPVCPGCGTVYDPEVLLKSRRSRPAKAAPVPVEDVEIPAVEDEAEDAVIEDAEELGDDTVEEVVEVEDES